MKLLLKIEILYQSLRNSDGVASSGVGGGLNTEYVIKYRDFRSVSRSISETVEDSSLVTIRYDTIGEFNVDWKADYSALSSTRSRKKKLKQTTPVPL